MMHTNTRYLTLDPSVCILPVASMEPNNSRGGEHAAEWTHSSVQQQPQVQRGPELATADDASFDSAHIFDGAGVNNEYVWGELSASNQAGDDPFAAAAATTSTTSWDDVVAAQTSAVSVWDEVKEEEAGTDRSKADAPVDQRGLLNCAFGASEEMEVSLCYWCSASRCVVA